MALIARMRVSCPLNSVACYKAVLLGDHELMNMSTCALCSEALFTCVATEPCFVATRILE
eukprot:642833-Amphidinium_carterae.1